jgi:alpha-beta hydrolase superfamily lysophospholipase
MTNRPTDRFARLPRYVEERARTTTLAHIPTLLAHPDWQTPAPTVIWLHGRTAHKELDPGRYLRWLRAGIAACAVDLPFHGERLDQSRQGPDHSLDLLERAVAEIDRIIEALAAPEYVGLFDADRLAIGGMSAGGMVALRRVCDDHPFRAASVEATCGNLLELYRPDLVPGADRNRTWDVAHDPARIEPLDPMTHLATWRPIPLLAAHSEADRLVPFAPQSRFIDALRAHYAATGADPSLIYFLTWPDTGAPYEHLGFGRHSNDAKNAQTTFLSSRLNPR